MPQKRSKPGVDHFSVAAPISKITPSYSFSVRWDRQSREPWSEFLSLEIEGRLIQPNPLPRVLRPDLKLTIYPDRALDKLPTAPVEAIGIYDVRTASIEAYSHIPFDTFRALLAMQGLKSLSLELTYPQHRQGRVNRISLTADDEW